MIRLPLVKTLLIALIITFISDLSYAATEIYLQSYCTEAEARAAVEAYTLTEADGCTECAPRATYIATPPSALWLEQCGFIPPGTYSQITRSYTRYARRTSQDYSVNVYTVFIIPTTPETSATYTYLCNSDPCDEFGGDDDDDGVCDDNDPCNGPNDSMIWKIIAQQYDSQGNICKRTVRIDCAGDGSVIQEKTIVYSESPDCDNGEVAIAPGDAPFDKTSDDWVVGDEGEGTMYNPDPEDYVYRGDWAKKEGIPSSPATGLETGIGSGDVDPADGDTGLLEGILDNTQAGNSNDQIIADYLKALNESGYEQGETLERILDELQGDGEGGDGSGGLAEAGQGVSDGIDGELGLQSAYGDAISEMQTGIEIPEEYQTKNTIGDRIEGLLENSPAFNYIRNVTVTTSGACSMSIPIFGKTIELTMCQWATQLQAWGAIMEVLTMLTCILIVFRRR